MSVKRKGNDPGISTTVSSENECKSNVTTTTKVTTVITVCIKITDDERSVIVDVSYVCLF